MRYLVTGGTGLIGSNVCRLLVAGGDTVRALVRPGSDVEPRSKNSTTSGLHFVASSIDSVAPDGWVGAPKDRSFRQSASSAVRCSSMSSPS